MNRNGSVFCGFLNNEHVVKKTEKYTKQKCITYFLQMCVSYIFTKIYMYIHTHVFSSTLVVVGDLAPISDDISYYASELATTQFADVSLCLFVRVFCRHTVGVFENHRHLCNL